MDKGKIVTDELIKKEIITQANINFDINKLEPGFYIVKDEYKELQFIKTMWNYGGANYITFTEDWQGPSDHGGCKVTPKESSQYIIKQHVESMDYATLEIKKV